MSVLVEDCKVSIKEILEIQDHFKTQKICYEVVGMESYSLEFVPDHLEESNDN